MRQFIAAKSKFMYVGAPLNTCQQMLRVSESLYNRYVCTPACIYFALTT